MRPPCGLLAREVHGTHTAILTAVGIDAGDNEGLDFVLHTGLPGLHRATHLHRVALAIQFGDILELIGDQLPATGPHNAIRHGNHRAVPDFCRQLPGGRVKKTARVANKLVGQQRSGAAALLVFLQVIKLELARGPVKRCGHCPAGRHDDLLFVGQQVTLGRHAALGARPAVRLVDFHAAGFAVDPSRLAGCRFERMHIDPVGGPDTGGKVNGILQDNRSATRRPG